MLFYLTASRSQNFSSVKDFLSKPEYSKYTSSIAQVLLLDQIKDLDSLQFSGKIQDSDLEKIFNQTASLYHVKNYNETE